MIVVDMEIAFRLPMKDSCKEVVPPMRFVKPNASVITAIMVFHALTTFCKSARLWKCENFFVLKCFSGVVNK